MKEDALETLAYESRTIISFIIPDGCCDDHSYVCLDSYIWQWMLIASNRICFYLWLFLWRYTSWGGRVPHRPVEDIAFAVARFFQRGGSFQNYYMVKLIFKCHCFSLAIWGCQLVWLYAAVAKDYLAMLERSILARKWEISHGLHHFCCKGLQVP